MKEVFYHFTSETLRDGSPIPPIGEWLEFKGVPRICQCGLHASRHPMDALQYAPGKYLHQVELEFVTEEQSDKVVAKRRKIIATIDSTELILRASRHFAEEVLDLWKPPLVVVDFLRTGQNPKAAEAAASAAWAAEAAASAAWAAWAAASAAEAAASGASAAEAASAAEKQKQRDWFLKAVEKEFCK